MKLGNNRSNFTIVVVIMIVSSSVILMPSPAVRAAIDSFDLANAILLNNSTLTGAQYSDTDTSGDSQAIILSSFGSIPIPSNPPFMLLSTGVAGANPVTTNQENPGSERGTWFQGGKTGYPQDQATLTLKMQVPPYMHTIKYDIQFFSTEHPDYVHSGFNDRIRIRLDSPSEGMTEHIIDVDEHGGDFILDSHDIAGTGFDIFAESGDPDEVDIVSTTPNPTGADAGATALTSRSHPVSPHETITIEFDIRDSGDNQFDSAVLIDNLEFSEYAETNIIARKSVQDINGDVPETEDILEYTITISNIGTADQSNNPGNEFEDFLPDNVTYVSDSATATSGTISYIAGENKITWDGGIPAESSVALSFQLIINSTVTNGTVISNQGTVYWDSNENGTNDATELTDDPSIDDGIDQDDDGDTNDDDPTSITVFIFEPPSTVTEGFDDDSAGGSASQSYLGRNWFATKGGSSESIFEVAPGYYYETSKSFKTKIRLDGSLHLWEYNLSSLESNIKYWEVWFKCGNASEETDLYLEFITPLLQTVAQIKFEYIQLGKKPQDWVLSLYYMDGTEWEQLYDGYLYNDWYKLRIERKDDPSFINYSLYRNGIGLIYSKEDQNLGHPFSDLVSVIFWSSKNPTDCQMFFWDEHKIGLTPIS